MSKPPEDSGYRDALTAAHERIAVLEGNAAPDARARARATGMRARFVAGAVVAIGAVGVFAVIRRAHPASAVVTGMMTNQGWSVYIRVPTPARSISYRLPGDEEFTPVAPPPPATVTEPDGTFTASSANIAVNRLTKVTPIEIRSVDARGSEHDTTVSFDPVVQMVASTKSALGMVESAWLGFRPGIGPGIRIFFTSLLAYKYALREIRYGIDADVPKETITIDRSSDQITDRDQMYILTESQPQVVTVKLVYIDGSESTVHRFVPPPAGRVQQPDNPDIIVPPGMAVPPAPSGSAF